MFSHFLKKEHQKNVYPPLHPHLACCWKKTRRIFPLGIFCEWNCPCLWCWGKVEGWERDMTILLGCWSEWEWKKKGWQYSRGKTTRQTVVNIQSAQLSVCTSLSVFPFYCIIFCFLFLFHFVSISSFFSSFFFVSPFHSTVEFVICTQAPGFSIQLGGKRFFRMSSQWIAYSSQLIQLVFAPPGDPFLFGVLCRWEFT